MDATTGNSNSNSQLRLASAVQCGRALGRASRIEPLPRLQLSYPRLALDCGDASLCLAMALETQSEQRQEIPGIDRGEGCLVACEEGGPFTIRRVLITQK